MAAWCACKDRMSIFGAFSLDCNALGVEMGARLSRYSTEGRSLSANWMGCAVYL